MSELKKMNLIASSPTIDVYDDGENAVKIFKPDSAKTVVLYEALTHSRVEETGLPIPKVLEVRKIDGRWSIIMEKIEGQTMADALAENPNNAMKYLESFVDIQLKIHSKRSPKISKYKDFLMRKINETSLDDVKKYELATRLESMPKHVKLCHGNYSLENVILNKRGVFIVDWVAAKQGNASADVAKTYLLLSLKYPELAESYLDLFCKKSDTKKKYVQGWLPIMAAAQLKHAKSDEELELLNKWIDVVDYE
ncbi:MAG: phosphotransferase [Clostridiales bacterium]|mgnify:CR=1 FL=1|nr:phosphotransferase [Clostridiales bacterium]